MRNLNPANRHRSTKVILLGDSAVGKTSIVLQFYKGEFETTSEPTIGAAYVTKTVHTKKGDVSIQIWDTAGQERFKSVIPMYTRACAAAILVCATDSAESVTALEEWLKIVTDGAEALQNVYVVLNKVDLEPVFDTAVPEKWAADRRYKFFRTSAKDGGTIDPLFQDVAESLAGPSEDVDVQPVALSQKQAKGCCG
jgi:small GTP-binding protein